MSDRSPVTAVTIACTEPSSLSAFYKKVTGYDVVYTTDDSVYLAGADGVRLGFDRVAGRVPPTWSPEQIPALRLDLAADGLADAERRLLALGATRPGHKGRYRRLDLSRRPGGEPVLPHRRLLTDHDDLDNSGRAHAQPLTGR